VKAARYAATDSVDTVVIGTGAGGAPLTARLAQASLSVVALEAGRAFRPDDHVPDETAADIYWMEERLSGGETPTAFGSNNSGMGVGGSTLHWGAFCPRPDPRDLQLKTLTGEGADWPIDHAELVRYIEEVEQFTGVSGPAHYPWDAGRRYAYPPVARNASADAIARGCAAVGITATDAPAALVSRDRDQPHWGQRQACINCGACHQGCRNASKTSMDTTYLPLAAAYGAEIRANCRVLSFELDSAGRITAVVYQSDGREHRQRCGAVFLCAGGVETPRLLLNLGIANSSGQVGRNFMAHVATQIWGRFDADMRMNRGYPSSLISEDMMRPGDAGCAGGYLIQSLGVLPVNLATGLARGAGMWGERLQSTLRQYNRMAGIGINGECLPHADNLLTLADETDAFGHRKARIDFSYHANEQAIDRHARRTLTEIWQAAGAHDIIAVDRSAHTIGTCRMGHDGDAAVVDPDGRSFDVPNLRVCDNSIFPSALAANPALTTIALSLRTADRFLASHH
jgi:choline dehydrogenase-like flavoprotein